MKYFTGKLVFSEHDSRREHERRYVVAGTTQAQCWALLDEEAQHWGGEEGRRVVRGQWAHGEADGNGMTITVYDLEEISYSAFEVLREHMPSLSVKHVSATADFTALAEQDLPGAVKTVCRNLQAALKKQGVEVRLQQVQEAMASTMGAGNWAYLRSLFDENGRPAPPVVLPEGARLEVLDGGQGYHRVNAYFEGNEIFSVSNHISHQWFVGGVTACTSSTVERGLAFLRTQLAALEKAQQIMKQDNKT